MSLALDPPTFAKQTLRRLLPRQAIGLLQQTFGMIDYLRHPELGAEWGPFNGQTARQALFVEIITNTKPLALIETGTSLGATTELMSQTGLPVFTIELYPLHYGFARARFWRKRNIKLLHDDSRTGLYRLFDGPLRDLAEHTLFFYLDAHGHVFGDDLPLAEELDIVFRRCPSAVIMIDDFAVPNDGGYGYDDYGPGRALVFDYIRPAIAMHQLKAFFPSTPSVADYPSTPMAAAGLVVPGKLRRGCVVLTKEARHAPVLASIPLLRPASEGGRDGVSEKPGSS
jgi:hypothetical protein